MKKLISSLALLALSSAALAGNYIGDYAPGDTVDCNFGTVRPSTGASFTLAGSPAISVYKDNSTTESTTGVTLSVDLDARTGLHHIRVTTGSDGTFYSAGSFFEAVITTGTVDSVTVVGQPVCSFSLNKVSALRPTTAARTLLVSAAGAADGNVTQVNGTTIAPASCTGAIAVLGIIDCGTAQAVTATTLQLRSAANFDADAEIRGATCIIATATTGAGQSRTVNSYTNSTDTATVDTWTTTPTGTVTYVCFGTSSSSGTVSIATGGITNLSFAAGAIDAPAIATDALGSAEVAASVSTELLSGLSGLSVNVTQYGGTNGTFASGRPEVNVSHFGGTAGTFASGRPEVNTTHWGGTAVASATVNANATQISGDTTAADNLETAYDDTAGAVRWHNIVEQGTAQAATSTTIQLRSAANFANSELVGARVLITGGSAGVGQDRSITAYVGATDTATVSSWDTTPSGTITYQVFGDIAPGAGGGGSLTAADVWTYGTRVLTANTNLNDLSAAGVRTAVGLASANLDTQLDNLPTNSELATALAAADDAVLAALTALPTNFRDMVVEDQAGGGKSVGCILAGIGSYIGGQLTTSGATSTYRDQSGVEVRISGTVISPGNRTSTITCPTY